ncbi:MAG: hypothetical protein E7429_07030 [Ruminococcaceae bacterium]|nr:hypothetical protein [Oscillospiraceae bacterium]MBE6996457.1 hypothetical protein [Oscillospiraceae bacterium]
MWLVIIVVVVVILYAMRPAEKETSETKNNQSVAAEVLGIFDFLHCFYSLSKHHEIDSTGVFLSWKRVDFGVEIKAYTKIFKIDGQDASEAADSLRAAISRAKRDIEIRCNDIDTVELYRMKQQAADQMILDFYGTDCMQGNFWDIDDCEYIDGRYLEFEGTGMVYEAMNQDLGKTLTAISSKVAAEYPDLHMSRENDHLLTLSFQ